MKHVQKTLQKGFLNLMLSFKIELYVKIRLTRALLASTITGLHLQIL